MERTLRVKPKLLLYYSAANGAAVFCLVNSLASILTTC